MARTAPYQGMGREFKEGFARGQKDRIDGVEMHGDAACEYSAEFLDGYGLGFSNPGKRIDVAEDWDAPQTDLPDHAFENLRG